MAIAYFSTWTTYGTWLPGDERGWYDPKAGLQGPDPLRKFSAELMLNEEAVILDSTQRNRVETTIAEHCTIRQWILHAAQCHTNHVHVVVTAVDRTIEIPREQFKSWTTRRLKSTQPGRTKWWTDRGWDVYIDN